jgi:hypothetical protein
MCLKNFKVQRLSTFCLQSCRKWSFTRGWFCWAWWGRCFYKASCGCKLQYFSWIAEKGTRIGSGIFWIWKE